MDYSSAMESIDQLIGQQNEVPWNSSSLLDNELKSYLDQLFPSPTLSQTSSVHEDSYGSDQTDTVSLQSFRSTDTIVLRADVTNRDNLGNKSTDTFKKINLKNFFQPIVVEEESRNLIEAVAANEQAITNEEVTAGTHDPPKRKRGRPRTVDPILKESRRREREKKASKRYREKLALEKNCLTADEKHLSKLVAQNRVFLSKGRNIAQKLISQIGKHKCLSKQEKRQLTASENRIKKIFKMFSKPN